MVIPYFWVKIYELCQAMMCHASVVVFAEGLATFNVELGTFPAMDAGCEEEDDTFPATDAGCEEEESTGAEFAENDAAALAAGCTAAAADACVGEELTTKVGVSSCGGFGAARAPAANACANDNDVLRTLSGNLVNSSPSKSSSSKSPAFNCSSLIDHFNPICSNLTTNSCFSLPLACADRWRFTHRPRFAGGLDSILKFCGTSPSHVPLFRALWSLA